MPSHPLTNFEFLRYHQNESRFKNVYSKNNLLKTVNRPYAIYLHVYTNTGTYWAVFYVYNNDATCLILLVLSISQNN